MKALSLTQPMAWAVVAGFKSIENRKWDTPYRGRFYVHASKTFNVEHYQFISERLEILGLTMAELPLPHQFIHGAIIGHAELVGVADSSPSPWFMGPYGFMLKDAQKYDDPIYCRGQLGFFDVSNFRTDEYGVKIADTSFPVKVA